MKMISRAALSLVLCIISCASIAQATPQDPQGVLLPRDSRDASIFRGGLVFANYCVTCHGMNADGNGRAAKLYNPRPANLRTTDKPDAYISMIVKKGGEFMGRSPKMPPWGEELTDEQIHDVTSYVRSLSTKQ